ncbi:MAG: hypothetical protein HYU88_11940 [Chloroflexi bacterium]|nr:hypothetical protein [Chloroflexota bacterium]MBI4505501.1 hypothetical protein [Chloroflexota bacterium]
MSTSNADFPTVAGSENFEIWDDVAGESFVMAFNLNGVTIAVGHEEFAELARVVAQAAAYDQKRRAG